VQTIFLQVNIMRNWKNLFKRKGYILALLILAVLFFYPFIFFGRLPIPADTIVGMYYPWKDYVWSGFKSGVPFKNPLITDPVRQQYVWRDLAVKSIKKGELPLWNPYSFSGTPLLANFQTAAFYPLNILFFFLPFPFAWGILVVLQPLLSGIFLYLYLRYFRLSKFSCFLGALVFSYSGFAIAWLEWNTIGHTVLWFPLILSAYENLLKKISLKWVLILIAAEVSSIMAGHLQVLFYIFIVSNLYLLVRIIQITHKERLKRNLLIRVIKKYLPFFLIGIFVFTITSIQWLPTIQFISQSARLSDQGSWMKDGWFLPWQNLIQFVVPDFFGNPTTGNYWGVWNYGEFISYIGVIPLIFSFYALLFRRDKKTLFFGVITLTSLTMALPTYPGKLIYQLNVPFISTSQPTRLLSVVSFGLSVLTALGFDVWIKDKSLKKTLYSLFIPIATLIIGWLVVYIPSIFQFSITTENLYISKRNLILPTFTFLISICVLTVYSVFKKSYGSVFKIVIGLIIIFDLFRFGWKFTSFSKTEWLFPETRLIQEIKNDKENARFMTDDRRILPPNFAAYYQIQDVAGYDPLYLNNYAQLISAWERDLADITPINFNRILNPVRFDSFIPDLLGVKYLMSMQSLKPKKLALIARDGDTNLYRNLNAFPRAFFIENIIRTKTIQEEVEYIYALKENLRKTAVTSEDVELLPQKLLPNESVNITYYSENKVILKTLSISPHLLVLTDIYYPSWKVYINGQVSKIYKVDLLFRGVLVPAGKNTIEFKINLI